jgi:hypothetical protein
MTNKLFRYLHSLRNFQRMNMAFARGGAMSSARQIDLAIPSTWEFAGFSQNGEDGIIEVLHRFIREPNRFFVEVGAADGLENNTAWLSLARRFSGLWIEGDSELSRRSSDFFSALNSGVEIANMFVTRDTVPDILRRSRYKDPDVFSLDIDGNDFHIVEKLLENGLRPKICIVEYNSAFGPVNSITVPYRADFRNSSNRGDNLYYGCSIRAWRSLFERLGYRFVTVDSNGVNAFFADRSALDADFLSGIEGREFVENVGQGRQYGPNWNDQFALIADREFVTVP